jgi:hypothetical protein
MVLKLELDIQNVTAVNTAIVARSNFFLYLPFALNAVIYTFLLHFVFKFILNEICPLIFKKLLLLYYFLWLCSPARAMASSSKEVS